MKKLEYIIPISFFAILGIVLGILFSAGSMSFAGQTDDRSVDKDRYKTYSFLSATTTSATSTHDGSSGMDIKGAEKVTFFFSRGDTTGQGNTGSSQFSVEVSPDEGTTWYDFNKLRQNTATSTNAWQVGSVTISAATSTTIVGMDLETEAFSRVRCVVVETTDGEHTCTASVQQ